MLHKVIIIKFLKVTRIVNVVNLRKFKKSISCSEKEILIYIPVLFSFCFLGLQYFPFILSTIVIIRATIRQRANIS